MAKILVVDDLEDMTLMIRIFLESAGHEVTTKNSSAEAHVFLEENTCEILITDILMPGGSGFDLIGKIHDDFSNARKIPKIIAVSGGVRGLGAQTVLDAAAAKADIALKKPFTREELIAAVNTVLASDLPPERQMVLL